MNFTEKVLVASWLNACFIATARWADFVDSVVEEVDAVMKLKAVISVMLFASAYCWAAVLHSQNQQIQADWRDEVVMPPNTPPVPGQEAVNLALAVYGIELPENVAAPKFDASIIDRGLTSRRGWSGTATVRIGPSAFSSWALLGSTLAHEIEVHCKQSFFWIGLEDAFGLSGTQRAERAAYEHELAHANRFGLSKLDQILIRQTMEHYYPLEDLPLWTRISSLLPGSFSAQLVYLIGSPL